MFILTIVWRPCATYFIKVKIALIIISPLIFETLKFEEKNEKRTGTILKCHQLIKDTFQFQRCRDMKQIVHLRIREVQS